MTAYWIKAALWKPKESCSKLTSRERVPGLKSHDWFSAGTNKKESSQFLFPQRMPSLLALFFFSGWVMYTEMFSRNCQALLCTHQLLSIPLFRPTSSGQSPGVCHIWSIGLTSVLSCGLDAAHLQSLPALFFPTPDILFSSTPLSAQSVVVGSPRGREMPTTSRLSMAIRDNKPKLQMSIQCENRGLACHHGTPSCNILSCMHRLHQLLQQKRHPCWSAPFPFWCFPQTSQDFAGVA